MEKKTFYLIADIIHKNRTWIKVIDTERLIEMRIPQDGVFKTLFYKAITLQSYREHYSFKKSRTWNICEYDLNLMAKSILCLIVFFCLLVMRSIRNAYQLPDDIDPDTMQPVGSVSETEEEDSCAQTDHSSNIDLYLHLLIEADEALSNDPGIDQMSPSYNIQLNRYIAERLESLQAHKQ